MKKIFKNKQKDIFFICFFISFGRRVFIFSPVFAVDFGQSYAESIGLTGEDPRIIIARLVQIFLTFLALIAVVIIIYGGFLWMTAQGNEEKVQKAKDTIKNAVIGLIIILASWVIVAFVIGIIGDYIDGSGGGGGGSSNRPNTPSGFGVIGSCSVDSVYPAPFSDDVARNTVIMVTFKEKIDMDTVCEDNNGDGDCSNEPVNTEDGHIKIYQTDQGEEEFLTDVRVSNTEDRKTLVFVPDNYLGSPSADIEYTVRLSNDVLNEGGEGMFEHCQNDFLSWSFEVGTELDLTPPRVKEGGIFPPPDNSQDEVNESGELARATGAIGLAANPSVFREATSTLSSGPTAEVIMDEDCTQEGNLLLAVQSDGATVALSNQDTGDNLGSSEFNGDMVVFDDILSLEVDNEDDIMAGVSWEVDAEQARSADTLTVDGDVYTFVISANTDNQISVGADSGETAENIAVKLDRRSDLMASADGSTINLTAQVGGESGNHISLSTNDPDDIIIESMSGGSDEESNIVVKGAEDQPRNSVVQINFNEAIIPLTVVGDASDVSGNIKISNSPSGSYLPGRFTISNQYRTIEFVSDNECGVNSCGETIYCLPGNSELKLEMDASELDECADDTDCVAKNPYNICTSTPLGRVCAKESDGAYINYPLSDFPPLEGVADAALNSLDGDRDKEAEGPVSYYDENDPNMNGGDEGDSFVWSFWINDEIKAGAPLIEYTTPGADASDFKTDSDAGLQFDEVMMSTSLKTGDTVIEGAQGGVTHKTLNLWNFSGYATGYWITKEGVEEGIADGYPDKTKVIINHTEMGENMTYRAQAGSGLKDIYQNCYKPSDGPACSGISEIEPSCCNGDEEDELGGNGNCP